MKYDVKTLILYIIFTAIGWGVQMNLFIALGYSFKILLLGFFTVLIIALLYQMIGGVRYSKVVWFSVVFGWILSNIDFKIFRAIDVIN